MKVGDRERIRKFGPIEILEMGTICKVCGERYGAHSGYHCPKKPKQKKEEKMDYLKDEKTVQAIKDSVRHWEENVEKLERGEQARYGLNHCKLCTKYNPEHHDNNCNKSCKGTCPLGLRGFYCHDYDSLFKKFHLNNSVENAQNMVLALKSLFYPEEPKKEEVFYHIGQRFLREVNSGEYILYKGAGKVGLVNIATGWSWSDLIVVDNVNEITEKEFKQICGSGTFTLKEEK